jgi:pimeloyl-ACP methyl ester carboxylesterase
MLKSPLVLLFVAFVGVEGVRAEEPADSSFEASDGVRIHYQELGEGTPVVLIHGYTANSEWKWFKPGIAAALAGQGYRVVAIDVRGHGRSEKPHDAMKYGPSMADDVVEMMDHLGIQRAHVHGFSMGGSILTQLLKRYPERVLSAIYGGSGPREVDAAQLARVPADPDPASAPGDPPSEPWAEYPGFDRAALDAVREYPWTDEQRSIDLTKVTIPVLAIVGEYDRPNARIHRMKREVDDFRAVVLPGETHGSSHFNPAYTEALIGFLAGL